ncbi:coiled-coil domain-containing protein 28B-like [Liolophura sinensis]|uniref:coiled-coil domain-containing protein 28B-like n=1 Tax=Liolophura sinensis TaxID=3198878 RepID=UPI00315875CC
MAQHSDTPPSTSSLTNKQAGKTWKVSSKMEAPVVKRPCKEHSFLTDVADVRAMEQGLVHLLEDFHSGKLQAFGADGMFDRMDQIREQQERLARLHFELDLQHHVLRLDSEDSRRAASENLSQLIGQLQSLSFSIQSLQKSDRNPSDHTEETTI